MAYVDIAVLVLVALFIIIGFVKGFVKPLVSLIGWGFSFAGIYFFSEKLSSVLLGTKLNEWLTGFVQKFITEADAVIKTVDYLGLTIATSIILLIVAILVAIINAIITKTTFSRKTFLNRFFGSILYLAKGIFSIFTLLTIIVIILQAIGKTDILETYFYNSTITKYLIQYNPIDKIFNILLAKA